MANATYIRVLATAAALAAATCTGCKSSGEEKKQVDESADLTEHNRLSVRMALAENVYNGVAAECAVYPKDFLPGTASLNELGERRVEMLINVCRDANRQITVIRGDEPDDVHAARIDAVRSQLADAGLNTDRIKVGGGLVSGDTTSSERAIIGFEKMMAGYAASPAGGTSEQSDSSFGATNTTTNQQGR